MTVIVIIIMVPFAGRKLLFDVMVRTIYVELAETKWEKK